MKRLIKAFIFLFFALNGGVAHSQTTASVASNLVENHEIVSVRPIDIMTQPQTLMKLWIDEPIPLTFYTEQEKEVQKQLNDREDAIIAYSPEDKIVTRDIDQEEITPFTWKWVYFEIEEENGGYAKAYLRRPSWWLEKTGATEKGKIVPLSMYEAGLEGDAKVMEIHPNQLDTRFWELNRQGDYVSRPITGKVEHYANNVVDLYFDDSSLNPLSVTTNHLIWSYDRDDWFRVDSLKIGEKLKTQRGNVTLTQRTPKEGWFIVYDLEVYRDHNFLVGDENVLVHNGCFDDLDESVLYRIVKKDKKGRTYGMGSPKKPTLADFNPRMKTMKVEELGDLAPKHGINDMQANSLKELSNEDLLKYRPDDPISSSGGKITGGHHRINEILNRIKDGTMSANTSIKIMEHD